MPPATAGWHQLYHKEARTKNVTGECSSHLPMIATTGSMRMACRAGAQVHVKCQVPSVATAACTRLRLAVVPWVSG